MRQIFKDIHLHKQIEEQGYVVIPFLGVDEINALNLFYERIATEHRNGIFTNVSQNNYDENVQAGQKIEKIFAPHINNTFKECYIGGGTYVIKKNDAESMFNMHQDWNNVQEEEHSSYTIWCPLIDCNETNGALSVIRGSHKLFNNIRCTTFPSINIPFSEKLAPYLETISVKAGEAIVFTHNLVHGSRVNQSNQPRLAAMCGIFPNEAQQIHYYYYENSTGNKMVDTYAINNDFYYQNITNWLSGKRLDGFEIIDTKPYNYQPISEEVFFKTLANNFPKIDKTNKLVKTERLSITSKITNFLNKYF